MKSPSMHCKDKVLLLEFPINGKYFLAIYEGKISKHDLLLRYRQKDNSTKSGWSRLRTPKHIHWAVDILLKLQCDEYQTKKLINFLLNHWRTTTPIKSKKQKLEILDNRKLVDAVLSESHKYSKLADKGEYSIPFLIVIAKLLMIQEKTNNPNAFMFKKLLESLKENQDIFQIVSTATHNRKAK